MGMFSGLIRRSNSDRVKIEDLYRVYFNDEPGNWKSIYKNSYKGKNYIIFGGTFPYIYISYYYKIPICSGFQEMKDHNNKSRIVYNGNYISNDMYCNEYIYYYNHDDDFILDMQPGEKHSLKDLISDCETFIDQICENELRQ